MDDIWETFAKSLLTVGPVGIVLLTGWYLWLRYPRPLGGVATHEDQVAARNVQSRMHLENREDRDAARDTQSSTIRIEAMQHELAVTMKDIASTLQRIVGLVEQLQRNAGLRKH